MAVESNGQVWVYDTQDHQIGGFSQQQGLGGSILFSSQHGTVQLSSLPVVSIDAQAPIPPSPAIGPALSPAPVHHAPSTPETDIFSTIERLGDLNAKGILSNEEFAQKKAELLGRL